MSDQQPKTEQTVTINGKQYNLADLSDTAKSQVANIRYVDMELERAKNQVSVLQAAREFYIGTLSRELAEKS